MSATPQTDDHVFLVGRPPLGEFLGFIRTMSIDGQTADQGQLADEWRHANDHVAALEKTEAGIADGLQVAPLPASLTQLAEQVRAQPSFQKTFGLMPTQFGVAELDRLIVFQKFINLGYIGTLKSTFTPTPTEIDIAQLAFGVGRPSAAVGSMQTAPNAYTFLSPSNDFRVLEAALLQPQQVAAPSNGNPVAHVVISIGFGTNLLNVAVENRLVLNNGSHRAYFLRELGITHVPCVIQYVSRRDELELIGGELQQNPDRYLKTSRPPLLKDYFDAKLRKVVPVCKKNRSVKVQVGCEVIDVPA
jgi:hypothetical protein